MTGPSLPPLSVDTAPADVFTLAGAEDYRPIFTQQDKVVLEASGDGDSFLTDALMKQRAYELSDALARQAVQDGEEGRPVLPPVGKEMLSSLMRLNPDLRAYKGIRGEAPVSGDLPEMKIDAQGGSLGATISENFRGGVFNSATFGVLTAAAFSGGTQIQDQKTFNTSFAQEIQDGYLSESDFYPTMSFGNASWLLSERKRAAVISVAAQRGAGMEALGVVSGFGGNILGDALLYAGVNLPASMVGGISNPSLAAAADVSLSGRGIVRRMWQGATAEFRESLLIEAPISFAADSYNQDVMGRTTYTFTDFALDPLFGAVFGAGHAGTSVAIRQTAHALTTKVSVSRMTGVPHDVQMAILAEDPVFQGKVQRLDAELAAAGKDETARALARDAFIKKEYPGYIRARVKVDALAEHFAETLHRSQTGSLTAGQAADTMKDAAAFAKLTGARPEYFATIGDSQLSGAALAREIEKGFDAFAAENGLDDTAASIFRNAHIDAYRKAINWRDSGIRRTGIEVDGRIDTTAPLGPTAPEPDASALKVTVDLLNSVRPEGNTDLPFASRRAKREAQKAFRDSVKRTGPKPSPDSPEGVVSARTERLEAFKQFMASRSSDVRLTDAAGMEKHVPGAAGVFDQKTETLIFSTDAKIGVSEVTSHEWVHKLYQTDNVTLGQLLHVLSTDVMTDSRGIPFHVTPELRAQVADGKADVAEGAVPLLIVGWNAYRTRSAASGSDYWNKSTTATRLEEAVATAVGTLFRHPEAARGFINALSGPDAALAKVFLSELLDDAYKTPAHVVPYGDTAYQVGQILAKASGDGTMGVDIKGTSAALQLYGAALERHGITGKGGLIKLGQGHYGYFPGEVPLDGKISSVAEWYASVSKKKAPVVTDPVVKAEAVGKAVKKVTSKQKAPSADDPLAAFLGRVVETTDAAELARSRDYADAAYVNYLAQDGTGITLSVDGSEKEVPIIIRTASYTNAKQDIYTGGKDGFESLDDAAANNGIPYQRTLDGLAKLAAMGDEVATKRLDKWGKLIENNFHWKVTDSRGRVTYRKVFVQRKPKDGDWTGVGSLNYPQGEKVGLQLKQTSAKTERKSVALARHQIGADSSYTVKTLRNLRYESGVFALVSPEHRRNIIPVLDSWASDKKLSNVIGAFAAEVSPDKPLDSLGVARVLVDWSIRKYSDSNDRVRKGIQYDINRIGTEEDASVSESRRSEPLFAEAYDAAVRRRDAINEEVTRLGQNAPNDLLTDAGKSLGELAYEYLDGHPLLKSPFRKNSKAVFKDNGLEPLPIDYTETANAAAETLMRKLVETVDLSGHPVFAKADADLAHYAKASIATGDHRLEFYNGNTLDALTDNDLLTMPANREVIVVYTERYNPAEEAGAVTEEDPLHAKSPTNEMIGRPDNRAADTMFDNVEDDPSSFDKELLAHSEIVSEQATNVRETFLDWIDEAFRTEDENLQTISQERIRDLADDFDSSHIVELDEGQEPGPVDTENTPEYEAAYTLASELAETYNAIVMHAADADTAKAMFVRYWDAAVGRANRRLTGEGPARNNKVMLAHKAGFLKEVAPLVYDSIADMVTKGATDGAIMSVINREFTTINMLMDNFEAAKNFIKYEQGGFSIRTDVEIEGPYKTIARELVRRLNRSPLARALNEAGLPEWYAAVKEVKGAADGIGVSAIAPKEAATPITDATYSLISSVVNKQLSGDGWGKELKRLAAETETGSTDFARSIAALYIKNWAGITNRDALDDVFEPFGGYKHASSVIVTAAGTEKVRTLATNGDIHGIAKFIGAALEKNRTFRFDAVESVLGEPADTMGDWMLDERAARGDSSEGYRASPDIMGSVDKNLTKISRWMSNHSGRPPEFGNKNIVRNKPPALSPESSIPQRYESMKKTVFTLGGNVMGFEEFMKAKNSYITELSSASQDTFVPDLHQQVAGLYNKLDKWDKDFRKDFTKGTMPDGSEVDLPPNLSRVMLELDKLDLAPDDRVDVIRRYGYISAENGAPVESARQMLSQPMTDVAQLTDTGEATYYGKFMYDAIVAHFKEKMMDTGNHLLTHMAVHGEVQTRFGEHHALSKYSATPYDALTNKQRGEITYDTLQAMLLGRPTKADGWALNVENNVRMAEAAVTGPFLGELKNLGLDIEFTTNPSLSRNILRASMGMKTDLDGKPLNDTILKLGDLWYNQNLMVNGMFAETGRPVTLSNSFQGLTVTHDKGRILGEGTYDKVNNEWFDFLMNPDNLDWEATFRRRGWWATFDELDERTGEVIKRSRFIRNSDYNADATGNVPIESAKANYLLAMWNEMWKESKEVQLDDLDGAGSAAKTHRQSLVFIGDKGLDYVSKWGIESHLGAAMVNSLAGSARSAALYKSLGRKPKALVESLVRPLRQGGVLDAFHAESLVGAVGEFTHETSRPVSTKLADITSGLTAFTDLVALPLNGLVQLNDIATTHSVLRQYDMGGLLDSETIAAIRAVQSGRADPEFTNLLIGFGVGGSIIQGELLARMKDGTLGNLNRLRDHMMNMNGMNALRNAQQRMFVVASLMKYAEIAGKLDSGEELNFAEKRLLAVGGIDPNRLKGISSAVVPHKVGSKSIHMVDLDKLADTDLASRLRAVTTHLTTFTSLEPDAGTRAMTVFGTKAGTVIGSVVRLVMKYTAIPSAVQAKTWMRFQNGYGKQGLIAALKDTRSGAAVHAASLIGLTSVIGYASYAATTALLGGDVEDPRDMSAGKLARVFLGANLLGRAYTVMNYASSGDDYRVWSGSTPAMINAFGHAAGKAAVAPFTESIGVKDAAKDAATGMGQYGRFVKNWWLTGGVNDTKSAADR